MAHKASFRERLHCISAFLVPACDVRSLLRSYLQEHFPNGLARWKLWKAHKKLQGWTAASLWDPAGRENSAGEICLFIPSERLLGLWEHTMRNTITGPTTPQRCLLPWYQLKMNPTTPGAELAWTERSPIPCKWVCWGSAFNTISQPLVQGKPTGALRSRPSAATSFHPVGRSCSQQHPAWAGWDWAGARMRSGCWITEQTLQLLL